MCGIVGVTAPYERQWIHRMSEMQSHRGPDNEGFFFGQNVAFGHQRLSILDLHERSNQPFEKNGLIIVFNGEIYNYREIKEELSHVSFITSSDTEVVLEVWRAWGEKGLGKLRGMFSFAIHDIGNGDTWLVRDPFGIKPLFYFAAPKGGIAFSSELKSLVSVFRDWLEVDEDALLASLVYVWVPEELCMWRGVKKLLPGELLHITGEKVSLKKYWHVDSLVVDADELMSDEAAAIEGLNDVLYDSVCAHLVSDVPVNAFLSGGLDSSLLVAMAKSQLDSLDCYTVRFDEKAKKAEGMADDAYFARKVSASLGVTLNEIEVKADLVELLPKVVRSLDEPIGDSAAINSLLICESAKSNGVKVLLSGMGADELFGGYRKHKANLYAQKYKLFPFLLRMGVERIVRKLPVSIAGRGIVPVRWAKRFLSFANGSESDSFLRSYTYYGEGELDQLLSNKLGNGYSHLRSSHEMLFNEFPGLDLLGKMCMTDLRLFMVSLNETYTDRSSMAESTEVRVPFIDKEVIRYAFKLDSSLKIRKGESKYILKKVAEKWLPHDVIYRPKSPFTLPLRSWVSGDLKEMVDDYLLAPDGLAGRGFFEVKELNRLVLDDRLGREDNAQRIWQLLTLEQWFREYSV